MRIISSDSISATLIDRVVETHGTSRYLLEPPYRSEPHRAHLRACLDAAMADTGSVTALAMSGNEPTGLCVFRRHAWDTSFFGFPVGRVEFLFAADDDSARSLVEWTESVAVKWQLKMASTRVYGGNLEAANALERMGYEYRETVLNPWRSLADWNATGRDATREAQPGDAKHLRDMASRMFRSGRFHRDARFDSRKADELYCRWVDVWFDSPSANRYSRVLDLAGRAAGFILYEVVDAAHFADGPVGVLILGGIDPDQAGRGLGTALWRGVLDDLATRARWASATVIAENSPIVNLYAKLGFRFSSTEITLHRWY